jgi:hypothetical protein
MKIAVLGLGAIHAARQSGRDGGSGGEQYFEH